MNYADLASPDFYRDPYPFYHRLRKAGNLIPIAPRTLITGHAEVARIVLADRKMGKSYLEAVRTRYGEAGISQPIFQALSKMLLMMNPPAHTRLRALLMKAFNARQVDLLRDISQSSADELINALQANRPIDLMSEFALPMPIRIICKIMDVPLDHASMLGADVSQFAQAFEAAPLSPDQIAAANAALENLERYFKDVIATRRAHPGTDLISTMLSINDNGETFSENEIIWNVIFIFAAGHETTSNMIGNALIALYRHPDQLEKLRARPELLTQAINECMRYDSSVQIVQRVALEDTDVHGIAIPKGTIVLLSLGATNRDPMQFDQPDTLLIERPESANPPLVFSGGIHYCLGARLAMFELETALGTILRRLPDLRLTNLDSLQWHQRNTLRGVTSLLARIDQHPLAA
ncbi:cytochrome [Paraburkholderia acidicola]|uniref:Cytochrome n=1 Tax=Paraburkholderia acidicola TaxID=1912599 RepID=A0A2A4ENF7_9BURK|nr:cytochrome P450 [Paraburkholderia acidicola]PCE21932.1 cytochrome [Paraburkholderia acidicola]